MLVRVCKTVFALSAILTAALVVSTASAVPITFAVDSGLSSLDLGLEYGGVLLPGQGPGSLTTSYSGTITVDVDDPLAPTTIDFLSASLVAGINGDWLPEPGGGTVGDPLVDGDADPGLPAPANYGVFLFLDAGVAGSATAYGAVRDLELTTFGGPVTVDGAGAFPSTQTIGIVTGALDLNVSSTATFLLEDTADSSALAGGGGLNMAGDGSYAVGGLLATLTVPVDILIDGGDFGASLVGTVVATATVPEPATFVLLGSGLAALVAIRRRRR